MDHKDCCEHPKEPQKEHSSFKIAAHATLHCLIGCCIGEFLGLAIGVTLGVSPYPMMALSTALAYISGFTLTVFPLMQRAHLSFKAALKAVWLGELISIGVMEIVMNGIDYHLGGMRSGSLLNPVFWQALAAAIPAGYVAALPVNALLISKQMKRCH